MSLALLKGRIQTLSPQFSFGRAVEDAYQHFRVVQSSPNRLSSTEVLEAVHAQIDALLRAPDQNAGTDIEALRRQLVLEEVCDGADNGYTRQLLDFIRDATRGKTRDTRDEQWIAALQVSADYIAWTRQAVDNQLRAGFPRTHAVGRAINRLRAAGYVVGIENGEALIAETEKRRIACDIRHRIAQLGGLAYVDALLNRLRQLNRFDDKQERYLLPRVPGDHNTMATKEPALPIGYLLNLAVRDPSERVSEGEPIGERLIAIQQLAIDFITTYDVEPYGLLDGVFAVDNDFFPLLREVVLYDGLFTFPQSRPSVIRSLLRRLFSWVDDVRLLNERGWTIPTAAEVANLFLTVFGRRRGPAGFGIEHVARRLPRIPIEQIEVVLRLMTHPAGCQNRRFEIPEDLARADMIRRPLVVLRSPQHTEIERRAYELFEARGRVDGADLDDWLQAEREIERVRRDDTFVLFNAPWAAASVIDAVVTALKSFDQDVGVKVGGAFEELLRETLLAAGVGVAFGKYEQRNLKGDCDAIVDAAEDIVLFEAKKKDLSYRSRAGNIFDLLVDMASGVLLAQRQLAQQELILRRDGALELKGGGTQRVLWANRRVHRIVVTLTDHGALQDRQFLSQGLISLAGKLVAAKGTLSPRQESDLAKLNDQCRRLGETEVEIEKLRGPRANPFHDCWFISYNQLLTLLDGVTDTPSFIARLRRLSGISTLERDFYSEFVSIQKMVSPEG